CRPHPEEGASRPSRRMGAASCFETAASPPPQHEADWAGAHGAPVGKCYHVRALPPMCCLPPVVLCLSCPGLTRASIERKHFKRRRWIAGSRPGYDGGWVRAPSPCAASVRSCSGLV